MTIYDIFRGKILFFATCFHLLETKITYFFKKIQLFSPRSHPIHINVFPGSRTMRFSLFLVLLTSWRLSAAFPTHEDESQERHSDDVDSESSRKIIGQR